MVLYGFYAVLLVLGLLGRFSWGFLWLYGRYTGSMFLMLPDFAWCLSHLASLEAMMRLEDPSARPKRRRGSFNKKDVVFRPPFKMATAKDITVRS